MKYIDSLSEIHANTGGEVYRTEIAEILRYLDEHPELTGKVITADRYRQVRKMDGGYIRGYDDALRETGTVVLVDPKPTNAELLQALSREWMKSGKGDFVDFLDERGVKAPVGDDE